MASAQHRLAPAPQVEQRNGKVALLFLAADDPPARDLPRLSDDLHVRPELRPRPARPIQPVRGPGQLREPVHEATRTSSTFGTFPPSGAIWQQRAVAGLLHRFVIFLRAHRRRHGVAGPVRVRPSRPIVFLPMAIAATALAVIWTFVYAPDSKHRAAAMRSSVRWPERGLISWLGEPRASSTAALIVAGIWGSVGFATVILSAAIKSISTEILEAARVGWRERTPDLLRRIILPMVSLPISVLAVTLMVNVIKLFDLIYVLTSGGPGTASRVIAFTMYQESFPGGQFGKGAADRRDHAAAPDPRSCCSTSVASAVESQSHEHRTTPSRGPAIAERPRPRAAGSSRP
ncbi:MAG: sugar ABC transporter permease [Candidatus Limnocylindrales bacterium]